VFYCFWFLTGIAMQLQILPLDQTVADHWFYFPIVGILGMIAILIEMVCPGIKHRLLFLGLLLGFVLTFFSIITIKRSFDWKNNLTLATQDNKVSPSYMSENAIGNELRKQGQLQEAKTHLEKSVELYPYMINLNNLALTYASLGDNQKAKETYLKALEFGDWYVIYENIGGLSMYYGDPKENIEFIKSSLEKFPQDSKLWLYLAILEYQYGDKEIAKSAVTNALSYSQNEETTPVYSIIMNNQPLKLNFRIDNVYVQDKK
jgi:tetratricopeptide (TPR) repeat protein